MIGFAPEDVGPARRGVARLTIAIGLVILLLGTGVIVVPLLMMMNFAGIPTETDSGSTACTPSAVAGGRTITLDRDQLQNAGAIIRTGAKLDVPARGLVIGVATALQESTLRNLPSGDRDSVGLFQQRAGWGSFTERTTPTTSATMFYTGGRQGQPGLLDIPGWRSLALTDAAQRVQRSAFPSAYAKWEALATSLVRSVTGETPLGCTDAIAASLPSGVVGDMLGVALQQQGEPYVWGATGPDAFDCSGLFVYSWRQAGYQVSVRTADQMYRLSSPVQPGEEKPGDILFGSFGTRIPGAGHMMIVVRPGVAVQAPAAGRVVEVTRYTADGVKWRLGRLPASAFTRLQAGSAAA